MPLPHSSFRFAPRQRLIEPPAPLETVLAEEPSPDFGEAIPESYDLDILHALVQDPFRIFIYWELQPVIWNTMRSLFSEDEISGLKTVLRLEEMTEGYEAYFDVPSRGSYWMAVYPGKQYQFEIGVYHAQFGFIAVLRSNIAQTPRGTISPEVDGDSRFRVGVEQFMRILEVSGFGSYKDLAATVLDEEAFEYNRAFEHLPESLRALIAQAARGEAISDEELEALPRHLRDLITAIRRQGGAALASAAVLHFVPEILHWRLYEEEGRAPQIFPPPEISPRFLLGSSDLTLIPMKKFEWRPDIAERARSGRSRD